MSYLLNNSQPNYSGGEIIPQYARTLNFRLTVRDNRAGGGGVGFEETQVEVTEQAGPFEIIHPNGNETWGINGTYSVEWEVASTDDGIINCQEVNIILMHNTTGVWEEIMLAENEENDGEAEINIPNLDELIGSQNRIKIVPVNYIFFDISNDDFSITGMSISEIAGGNIEVYPNPSNGLFTLRIIDVKQNNIKLKVYDISGKLVHQDDIITTHNMEKQLHLNRLNKGLYFIELSTPNENIRQTISIL